MVTIQRTDGPLEKERGVPLNRYDFRFVAGSRTFLFFHRKAPPPDHQIRYDYTIARPIHTRKNMWQNRGQSAPVRPLRRARRRVRFFPVRLPSSAQGWTSAQHMPAISIGNAACCGLMEL
jgi:hypothetical protein